ncbi:DUF1570 domain-containing protein [Planctomicrobium sp. SH668]|uniref:DUF1570 domain-containing protein n=1 Tax=Planctomicrobium sp. SH668 TaxID=3448126 RepID=UPI003F5BB520
MWRRVGELGNSHPQFWRPRIMTDLHNRNPPSRAIRYSLSMVVICAAAIASAGPMIELKVNGTVYQGMNVAHDKVHCWLLNRDGSLQLLNVADISKFKKLGEFQAEKTSTVAERLKKEYGRKYEVRTRGNYVAVAPPGKTEEILATLNEVESAFSGYLRRRNWPLSSLGLPKIVVLHPTREAFENEARSDDDNSSLELVQGFYSPLTNRVSLFDQAQGNSAGGLDPVTKTTLVHEAIHQLAFNNGLHERLSQNPRWVVEGLATVLEEGALNSKNREDTTSRINSNRLKQFQEYRLKRRNTTIIDLVKDEGQLYRESPLDFYAEAWAFTFYLSENRRSEYIKYLKVISERERNGAPYTSEQKLADMQSVFGKDLRWLETQFIRFVEKLE